MGMIHTYLFWINSVWSHTWVLSISSQVTSVTHYSPFQNILDSCIHKTQACLKTKRANSRFFHHLWREVEQEWPFTQYLPCARTMYDKVDSILSLRGVSIIMPAVRSRRMKYVAQLPGRARLDPTFVLHVACIHVDTPQPASTPASQRTWFPLSPDSTRAELLVPTCRAARLFACVLQIPMCLTQQPWPCWEVPVLRYAIILSSSGLFSFLSALWLLLTMSSQ